MCLYPKLIKNRKYIPNKKNGGQVPPIRDNRVLAVPVGCGKCMECLKKKAREWKTRLNEDIKEHKNGHFITLTFSNESIKELSAGMHNLKGYERDNEIAKLGVKRFLERWRKEHKKSVRHWLVTELGHQGTENIHLHGFIWTNEKAEEIKKHWKYGFIWDSTEKKNKGYVNEETIGYCVKYVHKIDKDHKEYKPVILCSKGIGKRYIGSINNKTNKFKEGETIEYYRDNKGYRSNMPMYYRNHTYTDEEREKLWIEKLDKEIRYVDGQEIDVSKNNEMYWRALKQARAKNKRLGYGDSRKDWDRKKYEEDRRNLLFEKRTESTSYSEVSKEETPDLTNDLNINYEEMKKNIKNIW